jgi:CRP-like cAMP-binding protein
MYNLNDENYKQRRRLYNELKLISKHKDTSHLISTNNIVKGSFLAEENKPVNGIYFILQGKVKVFNIGVDQKIKISRLVSYRDIIGLSSLNSSYYSSNAVVVESGQAYFINLKNLKYLLKNNNKLSNLLVNSLSMKLRHYEMRQKHLSIFPATERIIDVLLLIAHKFGETTNQGLEISTCTSRKDIAAFANTSPEKAIRTLSLLKSKKHIAIEGKKIIIKDKKTLINAISKYIFTSNESTSLNLSYSDIFY